MIFTGTFPVVVKVLGCVFTGYYSAFNPGKNCSISEVVRKTYRLIVRNSDGAPYVYSAKSNCNIITEFYNCINIPFRTVYAKRYERCELDLDVNEKNSENVTPAFEQEFSLTLIVKDCDFFDQGKDVKINHPLFHRSVVFENCKFMSAISHNTVCSIVVVKSVSEPKVSFKSCVIDLPDYQLVDGKE